MKNDWQILTLGGYLEERSALRGTTFIRSFPQTSELPEVTVGLGILLENQYSMFKVEAVPAKLNGAMENTFIAAVAEKYLQLSDYPNWQERLLLDLGHVLKLNFKPHPFSREAQEHYNLFNPIPEEERGFLLEKHGLHKIAMMVGYGHTQNLDAALTSIDELRGDANYGDILRLMQMGVPVDDLALAVQLPPEMVEELYGDNES